MNSGRPMRTSRLLPRPWREQDLPPFAAINADSRVMEFFPKVLGRTESDAVAARIREHFDHPSLPEGHPLRRHVLYRLSRARWAGAAENRGGAPQPNSPAR
jgi:hypothetical protein